MKKPRKIVRKVFMIEGYDMIGSDPWRDYAANRKDAEKIAKGYEKNGREGIITPQAPDSYGFEVGKGYLLDY